MKLTQKMLQTLNEIRNIEPLERVDELDVPDTELGNKLIELYYHSDNSRTQKLITVFMKSAGIIWLRKLVTRDTTPTAAPDGTFASLTDYIGMLADIENSGNKDAAGWR
ncbi:MAG: hypothetical protein KJP04_03715 [Arenicella sp.]|nr:hypothetical protein [Arenicella sp.]